MSISRGCLINLTAVTDIHPTLEGVKETFVIRWIGILDEKINSDVKMHLLSVRSYIMKADMRVICINFYVNI